MHISPNDPYWIEFWALVDREASNGCWEWRGKIDPHGYGTYSSLRSEGKSLQKAPNTLWTLLYGPIAPGGYICHHCDNKLCVNPKHLYLGNASTNARDMRDRGQYRGGRKRKECLHQENTSD